MHRFSSVVMGVLLVGCSPEGAGDDSAQIGAALAAQMLTPTSGGSLTDAHGNVWAFIGGRLASLPGDTCDVVFGKNGAMPYGGAAAVALVIYQGVLHQKSCVYGWYHDTGSRFAQDSASVAATLDAIPATADAALTSSSGSFVDGKGATWRLDANLYILRNGANVSGVPYPNNPWQTTQLSFQASDQRVYMLGNDGNRYSFDDGLGLFARVAATPQPTGSFVPPGHVVTLNTCNGNAAHDTSLIASAGSAGNTVQLADGQRCVINDLTLTPGAYYLAQNATLVSASGSNRLTIPSGTTLNGLSTCNLALIADGSSGATIGNSNIGSSGCTNDYVSVQGSSGLTIINNNFSNTAHEAITGYGPTAMNIDGNHFDGCRVDCIGLPNGTGYDSSIQRNVFTNTHLAVMEIGFGAVNEATVNLRVVDNWAGQSLAPAAFQNGFGYQLAYSIPLNGAGSVNNVIANNYANGSTPEGDGDICIEISGSATVSNNQCSNFNFGAIGYNTSGGCTGSEVFTNNDFSEAVYGAVVSYRGCSGSSFQVSGTSTAHLAPPPQPSRVSWGGRN